MRPNKSEDIEGQKGRPKYFDKDNPFVLNKEETHGEPDEIATTTWRTKRNKERTIHISKWKNICMKGHDDAGIQRELFSIIRIQVHDKHGHRVYNNDLWLMYYEKGSVNLNLIEIWEDYRSRFNIEHFFRFGKNNLLMTAFETETTEHEENWIRFVMYAFHQIYHGRNITEYMPRKWDRKRTLKKGDTLPPSIAQRGMLILLQSLDAVSRPNKTRGISEGRKLGSKLKAKENAPVIKKGKKKTKKSKVTFSWGSRKNGKFSKPTIKSKIIDPKDIPPEIIKKIQEIDPTYEPPI